MRAVAVAPNPLLLGSILPDFTFADAYRVDVAAPCLDARTVRSKIFDHPPAWVTVLMSARNLAVKVFGLKTAELSGGFPIITETPTEIVMGLDDRHLDFRIVIWVEAEGDHRRKISVATVVRTKSALGRLYLASVMPFHRLISRIMLERADFGGTEFSFPR